MATNAISVTTHDKFNTSPNPTISVITEFYGKVTEILGTLMKKLGFLSEGAFHGRL